MLDVAALCGALQCTLVFSLPPLVLSPLTVCRQQQLVQCGRGMPDAAIGAPTSKVRVRPMPSMVTASAGVIALVSNQEKAEGWRSAHTAAPSTKTGNRLVRAAASREKRAHRPSAAGGLLSGAAGAAAAAAAARVASRRLRCAGLEIVAWAGLAGIELRCSGAARRAARRCARAGARGANASGEAAGRWTPSLRRHSKLISALHSGCIATMFQRGHARCRSGKTVPASLHLVGGRPGRCTRVGKARLCR